MGDETRKWKISVPTKTDAFKSRGEPLTKREPTPIPLLFLRLLALDLLRSERGSRSNARRAPPETNEQEYVEPPKKIPVKE